MSRRVVLIGVDGATFAVLDPLMEQGVMPFLRRFMAGGARAHLDSVVPPLTPPAWVTLMTGRSPGYHGVLDFFTPSEPGSLHLRTLTSHHVTSEFVWHMADRAGRTVTALNYPYMTPPRPLNGYSLSGWIPWRHMRRGAYPPALFDDVKGLLGLGAKDMGMDVKLEAVCLDGASPNQFEEWIELHTRRERNWMDALRYLMQAHPTDLTAVLFDGVDKLQHLCWRYVDPAYGDAIQSPQDRHIRDLCLGLYRQLDGFIAEIVGAVGADATVVIASDHGFGPTVETFYLNAWLHDHGYLAWADAAPSDESEDGHVGLEALSKLSFMLDWKHTSAYTITSSSNGIRIRVRRDADDGGIAPEDYEAVRARLADQLLSWVDPATGTPVVTRVWTREEAFSGPHLPEAPDLTVRLRDYGFVSILRSDVLVRPRAMVMGTHQPAGIFAASGPGIRAGEVLATPLTLLDIAPLLLHALDVPVPVDLEGRVRAELYETGWLETHPVRPGAPTAAVQPLAAPVQTADEVEGEQEVIARLKALGYVE